MYWATERCSGPSLEMSSSVLRGGSFQPFAVAPMVARRVGSFMSLVGLGLGAPRVCKPPEPPRAFRAEVGVVDHVARKMAVSNILYRRILMFLLLIGLWALGDLISRWCRSRN